MRMGLRYAMAAVAILVAVVVFLFSAEEGGVPLVDWMRDPEGSRMRHDLHLAERDAEARELEQELAPGSRPPPRSRPAATQGPAEGLRGRAVRLDGSPAAGVALAATLPARGTTSTDLTGAFVLAGASPRAGVQLDGETWILLGSGRELTLEGSEQVLLVVAERTRLDGLVTDADGTPLGDAQVVVSTPLALGASEEIPFPLPARLERRARTDARGRFEVVDLPRLPFLTVEVSKPGYRSSRGGAPAVPGTELEVVLQANDDEGGR